MTIMISMTFLLFERELHAERMLHDGIDFVSRFSACKGRYVAAYATLFSVKSDS